MKNKMKLWRRKAHEHNQEMGELGLGYHHHGRSNKGGFVTLPPWLMFNPILTKLMGTVGQYIPKPVPRRVK